ncbi:hypothetical protein WJX72_006963 [[Myrmecia] bisecta]|uniref:MLO-like protein n=1 Tax=[Myrmecia] bisecta TaxID=41462 RepID=A0AAW1PT23_9CHLO
MAEGASFLETPTYFVAVVLFLFLAACLVFERTLHFLRKYLKKHNKHGLLAAVDCMATEVMLLGFVSLLLTALENDIAKICVPNTHDTTWILAGTLSHCPCCMKQTRHLTECFLELQECGPGFCNCGGRNDTCLASEPPPGHRHLLAEAGQASKVECDGYLQKTYLECGNRPGMHPAVSVLAMHEIHLLLFFLAIIHITMSCLLAVMASWRVRSWRGWEVADDAHAKAVRQTLDKHNDAVCQIRGGQAYMVDAQGNPFKVSPTVGMSLAARVVFVDTPTNSSDLDSAMAEEAVTEATGQVGDSAQDLEAGGQVFDATSTPGDQHGRGGSGDQQQEGDNGGSSGQDEAHSTKGEVELADRPPANPGDLFITKSAAAGQANTRHTKTLAAEEAVARLSTGADGSQAQRNDSLGKQKVCFTKPVDDRLTGTDRGFTTQSKASGGQHPELPHTVAINTDRKWLGRSHTFKKKRQHIPELLTCFFQQYHPNIVSHEEFAIMRASFTLTHRVGKKFNFIQYIMDSMEDDYAHIVGLGIGMWLTVILMVAVAGPVGWPAWWALLINAIVLHVVNTKLIKIIRHVCRGGAVHRLAPNIFWFHKPWLLLPILKTLLFINSFIFSSTVFFASQFGPRSCFFTSHGYKSTLFALPWWLILLLNVLLFLMLALNTLPLYSLAVQMGSDYKHHMVPQTVKDRLRELAQKTRDKSKVKPAGVGMMDRKIGKFTEASRQFVTHSSGLSKASGTASSSYADFTIEFEEEDLAVGEQAR